MASAIANLVVRFDAATGPFNRKVGLMRKMLRGLGTTARNIGMAIAPLTVGAMFAAALRSGEQFNRSMRQSLAIMGDLSKSMRTDMKGAALEVAKTTRFSASQTAKAYYFLASAGLDAKQSIAALPAVARFAQAGNFDLSRSTQLLTDSLAALGMKSKDPIRNMERMIKLSDVLVKANTLADASTEQFAEALAGPIAGYMRAYNISLEEGVGLLALLAERGQKGKEASDEAMALWRDIPRAYAMHKDVFKKHGLVIADSNNNMLDMTTIVKNLTNRLGRLTTIELAATMQTMGLTRSVRNVILKLFEGSGELRDFTKELRNAGGTTKRVADKQLTPMQKGLARLGGAATEASSALMHALGPAIEASLSGTAVAMQKLRETTTGLWNAFRQSPAASFLLEFGQIAAIGATIIATVPLVSAAIVGIGWALTIATGPLGAFIALATGLGALFVELTGKGGTFGEKLKDVLGKIPEVIEGIAFAFRNLVPIAEIAFINIVQKALELFPQMEKPIAGIGAFFVGTFAGMEAFFSTIIKNIIGGMKEAGQFAVALGVGVSAAYEAIKNRNFDGVGDAFMDAFVSELAAQADVAAPNAFTEFDKAFKDAAGRVTSKVTEAGGLSNVLAGRKKDLLDSIADKEIARDIAKRTDAAEKRVSVAEGRDLAGRRTVSLAEEEEDKGTSGPRFAGSAEQGTQKAWGAIMADISQRGKSSEQQLVKTNARIAKATEQMADEMTEQANTPPDITEIQ